MDGIRQKLCVAVLSLLILLAPMAAGAGAGAGGTDRDGEGRYTGPVVRTLGQGRGVPQASRSGSVRARAEETQALDPLGDLDAIDPIITPRVNQGRTKLAVRQIEPGANAVTRECALAETGDAGAAYRLGRRYLFGMGVPRDKRMGIAWMRAAASRGFPPAIQVAAMVPHNLGRMRPWCRSSLAPLRQPAPPPAEILKLVREMAPDYGLDPNLVLAVVEVESAYHTNAVSPKEAAGLMQLIPATAERFGVQNAFDPADNLRGGMKYLRWLLAYFEGNVTLALAGYNAGEHAVDRHGGVPPYAETQAYVRLIHQLYPQTIHRFDASVTSPSPRFGR